MNPSQDGPQVTIKEMSRDNVEFVLSNVDLAFANSIRRIMMAEIPTIAIDYVQVHNNTSVLADEFLAHRMGLLALHSEGIDSILNYSRDCDCDEYCDKCAVVLRLNAKCTGDSTMNVYAKDLISDRSDEFGSPVINDPDGNGVLLCKLRKEQEIRVVCIATKGVAKQHAKFSPVSACGFEYDPHNKLRHTELWFEEDAKKEWPPSKNATWEEEPQEGEKFDFEAEPDRFYFDLEAVGQIPPKEVMMQSLLYLQKKLAVVVQQLESSSQLNGDTAMGDAYDGMNPPNLAGGDNLRETTPDWMRETPAGRRPWD